MRGILLDVNALGQCELLIALLRAPPWDDLWNELGIEVQHFAEIGLTVDAPDSDIWTVSQKLDLVILTDNRNQDDPKSLEAVIRARNDLLCLPVITLGDSRRIYKDREYAHRTAEALLEYLIDIESLRGTGRLYIP